MESKSFFFRGSCLGFPSTTVKSTLTSLFQSDPANLIIDLVAADS